MENEKTLFGLQLFAEDGTQSQAEETSESETLTEESVGDGETASVETEEIAETDDEGELAEGDVEDLRRDALRRRIGGWIKESEELRGLYPDFDLRKELKNDKLFSQLVLGGAPVKAAYETVHRDEIIGGLMAYTADRVREQVVRDIETKGRRPLENGIASESAVVTAVDVNSLTPKDILKILKKVENGANIKF